MRISYIIAGILGLLFISQVSGFTVFNPTLEALTASKFVVLTQSAFTQIEKGQMMIDTLQGHYDKLVNKTAEKATYFQGLILDNIEKQKKSYQKLLGATQEIEKASLTLAKSTTHDWKALTPESRLDASFSFSEARKDYTEAMKQITEQTTEMTDHVQVLQDGMDPGIGYQLNSADHNEVTHLATISEQMKFVLRMLTQQTIVMNELLKERHEQRDAEAVVGKQTRASEVKPKYKAKMKKWFTFPKSTTFPPEISDVFTHKPPPISR